MFTFESYTIAVIDELVSRFDLRPDELDEIITHFRDDIEYCFYSNINTKCVVDSWVIDGKIKWKR
jgi:hypothetical protein